MTSEKFKEIQENDSKRREKLFYIYKKCLFRKTYSNLNVNLLKPTNPLSLKDVNLTRKEMAALDIHPVTLSVLCGTVIGDSTLNIYKGYANARLTARHSTRQTEWVMWKAFCAFEKYISATQNCLTFQKPDGKQRETIPKPGEILGKWAFRTAVDPELTKLHKIIAPNNKKKVQRFWLNHMNDYFLMTLWLDDGGLCSDRQGTISVNSMPIDQAQCLRDYIETVWGVKCHVVDVASKRTKTNPVSPQIYFSDLDNLEKFLRIVAPIIPVKSMLYKVCLKPKDSSRLQRWTSELKTLIRQEWHSEIDAIYAQPLSVLMDEQELKD